MIRNFWTELPKPFFVLAPLAEVTDTAFRRIIAKYSKPAGPAVFWTEFVSADGLCHPRGRARLLIDLAYTEAERPIVAQLFTANPEKMRLAAKLVQELGFDGLDINMGCPDRKIEKQGAGAALMKTPSLAKEIILAAREGAPELPISIKTRIGYYRDELETWLPVLLETIPAAITIHARTRQEMSKVPARWEVLARAIQIRDQLSSPTLIIGNGDVFDLPTARRLVAETGVDGVMLGRAIFGNPWLFSNHEPVARERLAVMLEHSRLFQELLGEVKSFAVMKKHFKAYVKGWNGAEELRKELMLVEDLSAVEKVVDKHFRNML